MTAAVDFVICCVLVLTCKRKEKMVMLARRACNNKLSVYRWCDLPKLVDDQPAYGLNSLCLILDLLHFFC